MRDLENYFFMDEDWDRPLILDSNDNVIMDLSVCDNMYSFVLINNKFYFAKDQSHDGAICNALFEIHNLKSIEQIERKFKDRIDNICFDIRKRIPLEGRYWGKANIIQFTDRHSNCNLTSDEAVQYICNSLNLNINNVNILQYIPELEMSIIKRYKQGIKMLYESKIKHNMKKIISKSKLCKVIRENINTSLRNSRLHGLIDQIDWYSWVSQEHHLSQEQIEQLKELRDAVVCFGEIGVQWAQTADEILRENGFSDDTMSYYTNDIHESKENKHSLFESADGTRATNRIITKLYKVVNMFNQIYRDDAWQNVMRVKEALSKVEGVKDVSFWAGQYHNYIMKQKPNDPAYRTYRIQITTIFDTIIDGELTCHAAGTVDDEFSAYDLTCSFWRGE